MKLDYVSASYFIFALVLSWDFVAPRVKLGQVRRAIAARNRREAARKKS